MMLGLMQAKEEVERAIMLRSIAARALWLTKGAALFGGAVVTLALVLGVVTMAAAALLVTLRTFSKSLTISHYAELDRMYGELLKLAIDKPHLRDPDAKRTDEQQRQYEYYAHLSWCVVEAIHDRAEDAHLLSIWRTAIEIENNLHREWFDRPENAYMFRPAFREYIAKNFPKPAPAPVAAAS